MTADALIPALVGHKCPCDCVCVIERALPSNVC